MALGLLTNKVYLPSEDGGGWKAAENMGIQDGHVIDGGPRETKTSAMMYFDLSKLGKFLASVVAVALDVP